MTNRLFRAKVDSFSGEKEGFFRERILKLRSQSSLCSLYAQSRLGRELALRSQSSGSILSIRCKSMQVTVLHWKRYGGLRMLPIWCIFFSISDDCGGSRQHFTPPYSALDSVIEILSGRISQCV